MHPETSAPDPSPRARAAAWAVHLLTATGAAFGLVAVERIFEGRWVAALAWMVVPVVIDSVDGTLARRARVKEVLPSFDGALLDNVVDYLNFVFIPALFLLRAPLLPPGARLPVAAAICLASGYQFCQEDAKTDDHFFTGFPSYWNVLVLYLHLLAWPPAWNLAATVTFVVLVFVPFKYIYPSRTEPWMRTTLSLTILWGLSVVAILAQLPSPHPWLVWGSLGYIAYYLGASAWLQRRPPGPTPPGSELEVEEGLGPAAGG